MAVRDDFAPGEVLAAADLNDTFASKLPYSYGTATPITTVDGFLWYDENDTPPTPKFWDGSAFQALTSGKILQVVRATDATDRSTTSTSFVDVTGMSVTITPKKSTSAVIIVANYLVRNNSEGEASFMTITDNSNNSISGAESALHGAAAAGANFSTLFNQMAYATPATTSAVTYKLRFRVESSSTVVIRNATNTGQMFAIEVSA
jgi:ABC-type phosphate/phosphonate transport system substrate-binding protein